MNDSQSSMVSCATKAFYTTFPRSCLIGIPSTIGPFEKIPRYRGIKRLLDQMFPRAESSSQAFTPRTHISPLLEAVHLIVLDVVPM